MLSSKFNNKDNFLTSLVYSNFIKKVSHPLLIAALYGIILAIFFQTLLLSDALLLSDGLIPAYFEMDWWNNSVYSGFPLIADPIWHYFYPLRIVVYKILHLDFNYYILSAYFLTACFTYGYVYQLTRTKIAAFTSGLLFCFSGYALFEIGHASVFMHTICWLPLILLAFEHINIKFSPFWSSTAIFAIAMSIYGGFPQLTVAVNIASILYVFYLTKKWKKIRYFFAHILAGYLLATPIIFPTFVQSLYCARIHLSWAGFCSYSLGFNDLILFFFPYLMGGYYRFYAALPIFGAAESSANHGYLPYLAFVLAGIALYRRAKQFTEIGRFWLLLGLLSILYALGPNTGFFYKFLYHIPVLNKFRAPGRYLFVFTFSISVLAGIGLHSLVNDYIQSKREKLVIFFSALLSVVFLIGWVVKTQPYLNTLLSMSSHLHMPPLWENPAFLIPIAWMLLSLIGLVFWLRKPTSLYRSSIALFICFMELLSTTYFSYWHPSMSAWHKSNLNAPPQYLLEFKKELDKTNQRFLQVQLEYSKTTPYILANMPIFFGLNSAGGYTSIANLRYLYFLNIYDVGTYIGDADSLEMNQAINMAGIRFLTTMVGSPVEGWLKNIKHFQFNRQIGDLVVYENLSVLPRTWFTSELIVMHRNDIVETIHRGSFTNGAPFNPAKTALVEKSVQAELAPDPNAQAEIKEITPTSMRIQTNSRTQQFLILSDSFFPGWRAYIDGKNVPIIKTSIILRGLIVPAGSHTIVYRFQPWYLYLSFAIVCFTLLAMVIVFVRHKKHFQ